MIVSERCDWDHSTNGIKQIKSMAKVLERIVRINPNNLWEIAPDRREALKNHLIASRYQELVDMKAGEIAKQAIKTANGRNPIIRTLTKKERRQK